MIYLDCQAMISFLRSQRPNNFTEKSLWYFLSARMLFRFLPVVIVQAGGFLASAAGQSCSHEVLASYAEKAEKLKMKGKRTAEDVSHHYISS